MAALTITEIIKLKKLLQPFGVILHTHDACGGQSFSLEAEGFIPEAAHLALEGFLSDHKLSIYYYNTDKRDFTIKKANT